MKLLKILLSLIMLVIAIQFIPYGKDHTNPTSTNAIKWDSPKTQVLFAKACADCHSFNTKWPWYSNYAPASWLIMADIQDGREHFNVSTAVSNKKLHKAIKEIKDGDMPPFQYTLVAHQDAKLTEQEKTELINGLKQTFTK